MTPEKRGSLYYGYNISTDTKGERRRLDGLSRFNRRKTGGSEALATAAFAEKESKKADHNKERNCERT